MLPQLRSLWKSAAHVTGGATLWTRFSRQLTVGSVATQQAAVAAAETTKRSEGLSISVTDKCVNRLRALAARHSSGTPPALRVTVNSGGCAGFQYEFNLERAEPNADDLVLEKSGVRIYVDAVSAPLLSGAIIDYEEELIRSAFKVEANPNAEANCSCGTSFAPRL